MHSKIVHSFHAGVHHKAHRESSLFTWLEDHRTDGRHRRSAALLDFNIGLLCEAQYLITNIGQLECNRNSLV